MNPSPNLILVGPMGAGKSTIGLRLAQRFGLSFADVDAWIEEATGATVTQLFECDGEAAFRQREREALSTLLRQDGLVLATGGVAAVSNLLGLIDKEMRTAMALTGVTRIDQINETLLAERVSRNL